jgi:cell division transport system permease protein
MNVRMIAAEALRSLRASSSTTFAATLTVLIGMFLLGLSISFGTWVLSWSNHVKHQVLVKVYFTPDASPNQINRVAAKLEASPLVKPGGVRFVSREEAFDRMKRKYPEMVRNLPSNPLPASEEVTPFRAEDVQKIDDSLKPRPPGVEKVNTGGETSKRIIQISKVIEIVFIIAVLLLLTASMLLIANTIRLSIFSRRREIEVMKLVGASNWFVRGPFMLEGILCGFVGALAAILMLLIGKTVALPQIIPHLTSEPDVHALPFALNAVVVVTVGLALGAAGSGLTIRRFLQV